MEIDRKTAYEHLQLANKKVKETFSNERHNLRQAKNVRE